MIEAYAVMNIPRPFGPGFEGHKPNTPWLSWNAGIRYAYFPLVKGGNMLRLAYVLWPPNVPLLWPESEDYEDIGP